MDSSGTVGRDVVIRDNRFRVVRRASDSTVAAELRAMLDERLPLSDLDLVGVDLSRIDLSGAVLDRSRLDGANLDGTDLRGCSAVGASFAMASMRGVLADGLRAQGALLHGARMDPLPVVGGPDRPSTFRGARLDRADMAGAILDDASFDDANMTDCSLARTSAKGTSFRSARLRDADFSFGSFVRCAFDGATMSSRDGGGTRDRTVGVLAVACTYRQARTDRSVKAFGHDAVWGKVRKAMATGVSGAALFAASRFLHLERVEEAVRFVGENGPTFLFVTMAASLLKDKAVEVARDYVGQGWSDVEDGARAFLKAASRGSRSVANLALAVVRGPGAKAVLGALQALDGDRRPITTQFMQRIEDRVDGGTTILFASRRKLARALEILDLERSPHRSNGDLYLIRDDAVAGFDHAPSLVRFGYDGTKSFAWTGDGKLTRTENYGVDDVCVDRDDVDGRPHGRLHLHEFGKALLAQFDVRLAYDRETRGLKAGRDGTVLVVDRATGLLDNPRGPATVAVDGTGRHFLEGRETTREPAPQDDPPLRPAFG